MAFEVELDGLSMEAQFVIMNRAYDNAVELGRDPLDILIELEQLMADYGYDNVFDFIDYIRGTTK